MNTVSGSAFSSFKRVAHVLLQISIKMSNHSISQASLDLASEWGDPRQEVYSTVNVILQAYGESLVKRHQLYSGTNFSQACLCYIKV
jgi:hypothetical protein